MYYPLKLKLTNVINLSYKRLCLYKFLFASLDLVARIPAILPHHIEGDQRNTRKQNVDIVRIPEAEEEIEIRKVVKDSEAVILEIETKDVTIPAQADHTLQIAQEKKADPFPKRSHKVLLAVCSQINRNLIQRKANLQ